MKVLAMAAITISFFLLAWLLSGTAFLNECLQRETVPTAFLSLFSASQQQGMHFLAGAGCLSELVLESYSANFETSRKRWVLCALTFP